MAKHDRNYNYFDAFIRMAEKSCRAADMLVAALSDFDPDKVEDLMHAMHTVEHDADIEHHEMMHRLAKEFITPIEREDIIYMASELDEVTDCIEVVMQRIFMYNIRTIPPEAKEMAVIISRCCKSLAMALQNFQHFKKASEINECIIEINRLEEDGDQMYIRGNRSLFTQHTEDPVVVLAWAETYTRLEKCCDSCEHVADVMASVMMKNS